MFRGIEIAASGMASVIDLNDIIANNLANVNTPGFKQLIPTFKNIHEVAVRDTESAEETTIGTLSIGSMLDTTQLDFAQGALNKTDGKMDIALNSEGFFVVKTQAGEECYTRNGGFSLNENGDLVTRAGDFIVGEDGQEINIDLSNHSIKELNIMEDGRIMMKDNELGKLKVVNFEDVSKLKARGNTLFGNSDENNKPIELEHYKVTQGYLETSNSNVIESMINSITGSRTYETLSKIIYNTDSTLKKAVNDVGRVMQ